VKTREQYSFRRFYYKVVLPAPQFKHGLFVELVLVMKIPICPV